MKPMKTTTTLCGDLADLLAETRLHERNDWAVRQIVIHPPNVERNSERGNSDPVIIVVFEKER